jgi:uncharacterized protein DUF4136
MNKILMWKLLSLILYFLIISGCATRTTALTDDRSSDLSKTTIISVKYSEKRLPKFASFSWLPAAEKYYEDARFKNSPIQSYFKEAIRQNLNNRGYRLVSSATDSDFLVGYVLALESSLKDEEINEKYHINPGLPGQAVNSNQYEKGTLIIDLIDPGTKSSMWRGAMQGFAKFDIKEEDRKKRINLYVDRLFQSYFN